MRLDNLHVHFVPEHAGGKVNQFETQVDPDAHVGRQHQRHAFGQRRDARALRRVEARSAHHRPGADAGAGFEIGETCLR